MATAHPIVISGGGIGGLATALALAKMGREVRVLEKALERGEDGAGIQVGPNGVKILQALGVADRLAQAARPEALVVHDGGNGRILTRLPLGPWIAARHGAPYLTLHRAHLHAGLLAEAEAQPNIDITYGADVVGFEQEGAGVRVRTADGRDMAAAALIGADGLWSTLRARLAPSVAPRPVGMAAMRSVAPASAAPSTLDARCVHIWLHPRAHVVHYPVNAGRDVAIVVIASDPGADQSWSTPVLANAVQSFIGSFHVSIVDLVGAATDWRRWALHDMVPLNLWGMGAVTLVGDAAHPVLPFLAQGAVMALEDAVTLADSIERADTDLAAGLRRFEHVRRARTQWIAAASARNGWIYHLAGASALARNAVLRSVSAPALMSRYDWLYGFTIDR